MVLGPDGEGLRGGLEKDQHCISLEAYIARYCSWMGVSSHIHPPPLQLAAAEEEKGVLRGRGQVWTHHPPNPLK